MPTKIKRVKSRFLDPRDLDDRIFIFSLALSLLLHIIFLVQFSFAPLNVRTKLVKTIEVVYPNPIAAKIPLDSVINPKKGMKVDLEQNTKKPIARESDVSSLLKDMSKLTDDFIEKLKKPKDIAVPEKKRKVSVPPLDTKKINNPVYLNYYQVVRQRIKEKAYDNYEKMDEGEVYLTFILLAAGELKEIKVIEEKTRANTYLRQVSLRSIEQSSPFPPFPSDLKYPELSFNVIISFELE